MKKYYLHENNIQKGPFTFEELKDLNISTESFVWFEGIKTWQKASDIPKFKNLFSLIPPPFNSNSMNSPKTPPPLFSDFKPNEKAKSSNFSSVFIAIVILSLVGYLIYVNNKPVPYSAPGVSNYTEKVQSLEDTEKSQPTKFLTASGTYRPNLLGNKFKVKILVINYAKTATFKDPVIRMSFFSKTNTLLKTEDFTFYETIGPGQSKTIEKKFDVFENLEKLGWEVVSAESLN